MTTLDLTTTCSACGAEESLDALLARMIDDQDVRHLIADVIAASLPVGNLVVRYLRLHKPPRQMLRMARARAVLAELVPAITTGRITRKGREWTVGMDGWRAAFDAVFDAQAKGTLTLPLDGNAYLFEVAMRLADQAEAAQERDQLHAQRQRSTASTQHTVQVRGQSMSIGTALQTVHAARDPILAQLDEAKRNAVPMPEHLRERLAAISQRKPESTEPSTERTSP